MAQFNTRIRSKSDTTANWNLNRSFVPLKGEIIIYLDYEHKTDGQGNIMNIPAIKIGDGVTYGVDLPFVGDDVRTLIMAHINDTELHASTAEKIFWNNKLNVEDAQEVVEDTLIFNRN